MRTQDQVRRAQALFMDVHVNVGGIPDQIYDFGALSWTIGKRSRVNLLQP